MSAPEDFFKVALYKCSHYYHYYHYYYYYYYYYYADGTDRRADARPLHYALRYGREQHNKGGFLR